MVPKLYGVEARRAARGFYERLGVKGKILVDGAGLVAPCFQRRVAAAGQLDVLLIIITFRRGHGDDAGCHRWLPRWAAWDQVWKLLCAHQTSRAGSVASAGAAARPHRPVKAESSLFELSAADGASVDRY